jgi:hypothetical protein
MREWNRTSEEHPKNNPFYSGWAVATALAFATIMYALAPFVQSVGTA